MAGLRWGMTQKETCSCWKAVKGALTQHLQKALQRAVGSCPSWRGYRTPSATCCTCHLCGGLARSKHHVLPNSTFLQILHLGPLAKSKRTGHQMLFKDENSSRPALTATATPPSPPKPPSGSKNVDVNAVAQSADANLCKVGLLNIVQSHLGSF